MTTVKITLAAACASRWQPLATSLSASSADLVPLTTIAAVFAGSRPDILILDRELLVDPLRVLMRVRCRWPTLDTVVVGAHDDTDVAVLLDAGADDAMPLRGRTTTARLSALARRVRTCNARTRIVVGDVVYDREAQRVWCAGREIRLSPTELAIFDCLFWRHPLVAPTEAVAEFVWRHEVNEQCYHVLRVYIGYLRNKLSASEQVAIRTVRGLGYALVLRAFSG
jgi:two-component system OmpR family response regulator